MASAKDLRRIAMSLDGTTEMPHFDRMAFRAKRIFATLAADEPSANLRFTPDTQAFHCMLVPEAFTPVPNVWGRQGWTVARLSALDEMQLEQALHAAWEGAAGKRIRAR